MKKNLLIWFILQIIFVFVITGFLVNGKSDIAGNLFVIFIVQSAIFLILFLYANRKWFS